MAGDEVTMNRRALLRSGAALPVLAWAAPVVTVLRPAPALAASPLVVPGPGKGPGGGEDVGPDGVDRDRDGGQPDLGAGGTGGPGGQGGVGAAGADASRLPATGMHYGALAAVAATAAAAGAVMHSQAKHDEQASDDAAATDS